MAVKKVSPTKRPEYDRTVFEVLHALRDRTSSAIARDTYVSATTISKWRKGPKFGGTRYPQHHTLAAVAAVAGFKFELRDQRTGEPLDVRDVKEPTAPPKAKVAPKKIAKPARRIKLARKVNGAHPPA